MNSDHKQLIAKNIPAAICHEIIDSVVIDTCTLYLVKIQVKREHINDLNWMAETIHLADGTEIVSLISDPMRVSDNMGDKDTYEDFKRLFNDFNIDKMVLPGYYWFLATNDNSAQLSEPPFDKDHLIKAAYDSNKDKSVTATMYNILMVWGDDVVPKFHWGHNPIAKKGN